MDQFRHPLVLGIDQNAPSSHMPLAERLAFYGSNTGNLLFGEALYQVIDHGIRSTYHFRNRVIEDADVVVIAAANWINPHSDFGGLARRLKSFGKPVVLVGIGIQVDDAEKPKVTHGTRELLDLAAETSALISVRGYQTEQVLKSWGYSNVVATGCPSLLLSDGRFTSHAFRPAPTADNVVLLGTRHQLATTSPEQSDIYRIAYANRTDILMQSELADMYFILDEPRDPVDVNPANSALSATYGDANINNLRGYLRRHGKVFFDARDWRAYLQTKEYVVGTRIHGTIAAILSGRRGLLLNHDPRTAELAEIMGIPTASLAAMQPLSLERIFEQIEQTDFDLTLRNFARYYERFSDFFAKNGLALRQPPVKFGECPPE